MGGINLKVKLNFDPISLTLEMNEDINQVRNVITLFYFIVLLGIVAS